MDKAISLTEPAAEHVRAQLAERGRGAGIRLGVRNSGCSGLAYVLEFADEQQPDDEIIEAHGVKLFVDAKSLVYLQGTELDLVREGLNVGLKFNNPNVKAECGCGESFNI